MHRLGCFPEDIGSRVRLTSCWWLFLNMTVVTQQLLLQRLNILTLTFSVCSLVPLISHQIVKALLKSFITSHHTTLYWVLVTLFCYWCFLGVVDKTGQRIQLICSYVLQVVL